MQPVGSILHSQVPVACPSPQTTRCSPCPTSHFLLLQLNIIILSTHGSSKWSLSFVQVSPTKPCICLSCPPYALHTRPPYSSQFNHPTILDEQYRSLSSCGFLHPPYYSFHLGLKHDTTHTLLNCVTLTNASKF